MNSMQFDIFLLQLPRLPSAPVLQRQTECYGQRDVTGYAGLMVSRTAPVHEVPLEI